MSVSVVEMVEQGRLVVNRVVINFNRVFDGSYERRK